MDQRFKTQYPDEESLTKIIMSATTSDELTMLQINNRHLLAKHPETHELLIQMSHELRETIPSNGEGWEG